MGSRRCATVHKVPMGDELLLFITRQLPELRACLLATDYRKIPAMSEDEAIAHLHVLHKACTCPECLEDDSSDGKI